MGFKKIKEEIEIIRRWPYDFITEEIKTELGSFEQDYKNHCTGKRIHNEIIGHTFQGIEDWCAEENAIIKKDKYWFVRYNLFNWWRHKEEGMRELWRRRDYAKRMELKDLDKIAKSFPKEYVGQN